jgi:TetR/AcrR family transcriptional repressor of nem operon
MPSTERSRGRPRGFSEKAALEGAMRTFWASGYDGTSVDMLCKATQMSRASLYQGYGDKSGLFLAAIAHYVETRVSRVADALGPHGSLHDDLTKFFTEVVRLATSDPETPGCLVSCVLADVAGSNETFRNELDQRFLALEARIANRLREADWPEIAEVPPSVAAGLVGSIARGIMVRARSKISSSELVSVAEAAVAALLHLYNVGRTDKLQSTRD